MTYKIVTLAGDGIGPEIMEAGLAVLEKVAAQVDFHYDIIPCAFGGAAIDQFGTPLPEDTLTAAQNADAILHGSIGHPKFDQAAIRPEQGLLAIRKALGLFANIRPLKIYDSLADISPVKQVAGVDFVVVRELTGGIYFGEHTLSQHEAQDVCTYLRSEIERVARVAFDLARTRRKHVTSIDKQNVLATSKLWRQVVTEVAADYPDVTLAHQLVDSAAMLLITNPSQFDVILTENLFGDILTDEAAAIAGTLGVMASSSTGSEVAFYEPIHGSAPDIAGLGIANPIGMILSVAMMLETSFGQKEAAINIEQAVKQTLEAGIRTKDLGGTATTAEMRDAIIARL
ncbi:MAG: 3-isopropylmalate dehydrogenase [Defluviitaleaceae bacterium]|nr:3-isopropylmalate dehydrogenase [Defluviitaleaceae bacterium]